MSEVKQSPTPRIYEYVADDGTTYWSLSQSQPTVSPPLRLVLQDRKGFVLGQFLGRLRAEVLARRVSEEEIVG